MRRLVPALLLGVLTATAGGLATLVPLAARLEENLGLDLLFTLRGSRPPPAEVVIVSIDKQSADELGVPRDSAKWPRTLHARLLDTLSRQGAAMVAFDIVFDQPGVPDDDRRLAEALARGRNVVLGQYLTRETVPMPGTPGGHLIVERAVPPVALLDDAALAVAPFPLPKTPVRVSQYWTFKTSAGDLPTLPVVAFQVFTLDAYDRFVRLFEEVSPYHAERLPRDRAAVVAAGHAERLVRLVRDILQHEAPTIDRMRERLRSEPAGAPGTRRPGRRLLALLEMYRAPPSQYLNFYGPPRTITTLPYHRVLQADPPAADLRGKAVFVGLSENLRLDQKDGFYTVFSEPTGYDLSGVEIAATAFANLLEMMPVHPLAPAWQLATPVLWGLVVGLLTGLLAPAVAAASLVAAGCLYLLAALRAFKTEAVWCPVVVPLLFQPPLAFVGAVLWRYRRTFRERENVRRALGFYVPAQVADQVARTVGNVRESGDLAYGTCLSTDAHRYTALAETMDPKELAAFMNEYYAVIFGPVKRHGGIVSDVVGDSMLAIWATAEPDAGLRGQACRAALDIASATDQFNLRSGARRLPTRVGLHSGPMVLGNIGAMDHFEYRAVGDIVNTATRLEGLNKQLETRVLASDDVLRGVDGFLTRELGTFLLAGKTRPLLVHELLGREADADAGQRDRCATFAAGLAAFRERRWKEAIQCFDECVRADENDGPSRFYGRRCDQLAASPPEGIWDGVIQIDWK